MYNKSMNKVIKEDTKIKVSRFQIDNLIDKFIKKESAFAISKAMWLNIKTVNRYLKEFRRIIVVAEQKRFDSLIKYLKPSVKFAWLEDSDDEESTVTYYLYFIRDQYIYVVQSDDEFETKITLQIKDDCKEGYIRMFKKELTPFELRVLGIISDRIEKERRFFKSSLLYLLMEEAFRINVRSDGSELTKQYMKDIFREYPLYSEKGS